MLTFPSILKIRNIVGPYSLSPWVHCIYPRKQTIWFRESYRLPGAFSSVNVTFKASPSLDCFKIWRPWLLESSFPHKGSWRIQIQRHVNTRHYAARIGVKLNNRLSLLLRFQLCRSACATQKKRGLLVQLLLSLWFWSISNISAGLSNSWCPRGHSQLLWDALHTPSLRS